MDYDIIAYVETLHKDQIYIIKKYELENILKPKWKHKKGTADITKI